MHAVWSCSWMQPHWGGGTMQEVKEHSALQPMSVEYTLLPEIKLIKAVQTVLVCAMHLAGQVCLYSTKKLSSTNLVGTCCTADASGVCRSKWALKKTVPTCTRYHIPCSH